jgi:hypothetical protein
MVAVNAYRVIVLNMGPVVKIDYRLPVPGLGQTNDILHIHRKNRKGAQKEKKGYKKRNCFHYNSLLLQKKSE